MANTLKLEILTPEAVVYSDEVDMVMLPGVEGQMGILPHHVRLMTQLIPGEIIVRKEGHAESLAIGEGLVEVTGRSVSILTAMAVAADKIDEAAVQEAYERAAARLREKLSSEEIASVNAALTRCASSVVVANRCHGMSHQRATLLEQIFDHRFSALLSQLCVNRRGCPNVFVNLLLTGHRYSAGCSNILRVGNDLRRRDAKALGCTNAHGSSP